MLNVNRFVVGAGMVASVAGSASGAATAFRGTHIGFDTATGTAGEQLQLRTGYGTQPGAGRSEPWAFPFASVSGQTQLQTRSACARCTTDPNPPFDQASYNLKHAAPTNYRAAEGGGVSPVAGWYANSSMAADPVTDSQTFNPTGADSFVSLGRLNGGSFAWEDESRDSPRPQSPAELRHER